MKRGTAEPSTADTGAGRHMALRAAVFVSLLALLAACGDTTDGGVAGGGPGGETQDAADVRMARASWATGHLQAEINRQLLEELGYEVSDPADATWEPETFYPAAARGELDLWVNGWFPLHEPFFESRRVTGQAVSEPLEAVGVQVPDGAVQGYLVDASTAEELDVTSMEDFTRPEVVEAFDQNGNGRADLYGCNEGWGCHLVIEDHLSELAWGESVEQVVGDYDDLMAEAEQRIAAGEPTLFYTWTPNWTIDVLEPGEDVLWLESPALPDENAPTEVVGLEGCAGDDPCHLGWVVNDIRAVANRGFLDDHPPVRRLLGKIEIPLEDIAEQNARMHVADEYTEEDLEDDAADWIAANRALVDEWLATARPD